MTLVTVGLALVLTGFAAHAVVHPAAVADVSPGYVSSAGASRQTETTVLQTEERSERRVHGVLLVTPPSLESVETGSSTQAGASGQSRQASLEGTEWRAVDVPGGPMPAHKLPRKRGPHLVFDVGGLVSGADGCNRITGSYMVNGSSLTFGPFAGTQMFCQNTDALARRFQQALKGTSRWNIVAGRLELYGTTGKPLAVFERVYPPTSAATQ